METSSSTGILDSADCVVVTGGTLNPWTELVAREAGRRAVPVVYSELAWATPAPYHSLPALSAASVLSPFEVPRISSMLGDSVKEIAVTGIPALDDLPAYSPVEGVVLILSTVDMLGRDPEQVLLTAARSMQASGTRIRVRCHPREDRTPWKEFEIVENETQVESASTASVVVGYPGSAHVLAAAAGAPVVSVEPNSTFSAVLSAQEAALMSARPSTLEGTLVAALTASPCDQSLLESVVGPVGGASHRMVKFWEQPRKPR